MVIDDNEDAAEALAMMLEIQGHEPRVAHDGPAALELAKAFAPELAFLDIGLPGMNGYELAERLRRDPGLSGCYLVALTGWGSDEDRRRAAAAGFDEHFVKPLDPARMSALLTARAGA
jgi:CheY-like chemotaxis protein